MSDEVFRLSYVPAGSFFYMISRTTFMTHTFQSNFPDLSRKVYFLYDALNKKLLESFLRCLPDIDRCLIKGALDNLDSVDENEIHAFSNLRLRVFPSKDNLRSLWLSWHAMNLIIKKPSFVTLCWFPFLRCHLKPLMGKLEYRYKQSIYSHHQKNSEFARFPKGNVMKL